MNDSTLLYFVEVPVTTPNGNANTIRYYTDCCCETHAEQYAIKRTIREGHKIDYTRTVISEPA